MEISYCEDKKNRRFFIGSRPKDDINCMPFDYFLEGHINLVAEREIKIAKIKGNSDKFTEFLIRNIVRQQVYDFVKQIMNSTLPDFRLQQILANNQLDKKAQERLWKSCKFKTIDLFWFNWLAQKAGYLLDVYHVETIPAVYKDNKKPLVYLEEDNGNIELIGETDLSKGQLKTILKQRKMLQLRLYHINEYWHCFYFTGKGLSGLEHGYYGSQSHYHYISDKYGIAKEYLLSCFRENKLSSGFHLPIDKNSDLIDYIHIRR